jgi:hypothetical protein
MRDSFIFRKQEDKQPCPLLCYVSQQKPHNILRTTNLFDAISSGLMACPILVDLHTYKILHLRIPALVVSLAMFVHSFFLVMYYKKMMADMTFLYKSRFYG